MAPETEPTGSGPPTDLKPAALAAELTAASLRPKIPLDVAGLLRAANSFETSEMLGQQRALDSVRLAIGIDAPGYNVYVSGLRTRHERESVLRLLSDRAANLPTPGDWIYVNNFRNPEAPNAIYLRAGQGRDLSQRMNGLVNYVLEQLPKAFRREDFDRERSALRDKYNRRGQELFGGLEAKARERGFAMQGGPNGQLIFIPLIAGKL